MMKYYLAIDIGASSGRHIVGHEENGRLVSEEIYRFPNGVKKREGHLVWDIEELLLNVKKGLDAAIERYGEIRSFSIDTWGVDYVLMKGDREILPCYAYRDDRTEKTIPLVHEKIPFTGLYERTGIQFQPFNTIYQLYSDKISGRLDEATDFLMMPEYLSYKLCGVKAHEYTNATTTGMVDASTRLYDEFITETLGLPKRLFGKIEDPGKAIGEYRGVKCVLCASHDTASAVEGIPMDGDRPFISSGTWSLLGVKSKVPVITPASRSGNWTNEGGVGYIRYLKNITGMWLINNLRSELCPEKSFDEIAAEARSSLFDDTVDANSSAFLAPESMKEAFDKALKTAPERPADYFRCAYRSLALSYANAIGELERNVGERFDSVVVVGGGAKNAFLNELTEAATGKKVIAIPIEATALGNLKIQIKADSKSF
ncbi:MAG: rhamnulokinase [Clostridia bacterium]|nr:rhamnulokinase [Clostridia bacterium]